MNNRPMHRGAVPEIYAPDPAADEQALVVDSAISHCEKLRRVLELEEWIREARDCPLLDSASIRWQSEREQLIAELELSH